MENLTTNDNILEDFHMVTSLKDASTGQRFVNYLIDAIVFMIFLFFYGILSYLCEAFMGISISPFDDNINPLLQNIYSMIFYAVFYIIVEGVTKGRTLGKLITKTKVIHIDGNKLVFKDFVLRSLCRIVPFEPLSAFGGYPWHDTWTKTRVVQIR
ncbi:RDD family protein [Flavihumibacter sp. UBA7668]|uniref:RDD family protein n=1 Tax=Flavihumibacter sp. UBA7668 TaxID=1946542 RepID=UPI0025BAC4A0|nr:RDD family protein [Flavihumibacter sp. UBA7668]